MKKIFSAVASLLIIAIAVTSLGFITGGFRNWQTNEWLTDKSEDTASGLTEQEILALIEANKTPAGLTQQQVLALIQANNNSLTPQQILALVNDNFPNNSLTEQDVIDLIEANKTPNTGLTEQEVLALIQANSNGMSQQGVLALINNLVPSSGLTESEVLALVQANNNSGSGLPEQDFKNLIKDIPIHYVMDINGSVSSPQWANNRLSVKYLFSEVLTSLVSSLMSEKSSFSVNFTVEVKQWSNVLSKKDYHVDCELNNQGEFIYSGSGTLSGSLMYVIDVTMLSEDSYLSFGLYGGGVSASSHSIKLDMRSIEFTVPYGVLLESGL